MVGNLLLLDAGIRRRFGRRWMSYRDAPVPLWFRAWLRLPCWLVGHNWLHQDPLTDMRLWWCSKCDRRETRA